MNAGSRNGHHAVPLPSGKQWLLAGGYSHALGPGPRGRLLAWGDNGSGQIGDGTNTRRNQPVVVAFPRGAGRIVAAAAGTYHSLALTRDGSVWAWGRNASGQLGNGTTADSTTPARVTQLHHIRAIAAGGGFSLALQGDGTVWAWGHNKDGQLGDGNAPFDHQTPETVYGLGSGSGVVAISAGYSFALALKRNGAVVAWANGTSGQLGNGATTKKSVPTPVTGLGPGSGVVAVAAGGSFSVALKRNGSVWAWGNNASGELGNDRMPKDALVPTEVKGLGAGSGVVAIAAGYSFALALKSDGTVLAWGRGKSGEMGNGSFGPTQPIPVEVTGLGPRSGVIGIAAGASHSMALERSGRVLTWGNNSHGQLGDGTAPEDHNEPVVAVPATART
jgi:alpha-tubulin suppressor-like RCC1 family protein